MTNLFFSSPEPTQLLTLVHAG